jgi:hypothetical protein
MAGLLDFLNSEDAQMGIGLLAAGGPTTDPDRAGFGARLASAQQYAQAQREAAMKRRLQQAEIEAAMAKQTGMKFAMGLLGGDDADAAPAPAPNAAVPPVGSAPIAIGGQLMNAAPAGGAMPAPGGGAGAAPPPPMAAQAAKSRIGSLSVDQVAGLKMMGYDFTALWDSARFGKPVQPGWIVKADGTREYVKDPKDPLDYDAAGNVVGVKPEALRALTYVEGAKQEQGKRLDMYYDRTPYLNERNEKVIGGPPMQMPPPMFPPPGGGAQPQQAAQPARPMGPPPNISATVTARPEGAEAQGAPRFGVVAPGVPQNLTDAIVMTESSGNPNAKNPESTSSGRMGTLSSTALQPGLGIRPARDLSEAEKTRVGAETLSKLHQKYNGNEVLATLAYNWGFGNVDKWLKAGGNWGEVPPAQQAYVTKVMERAMGGAAPAAAAAGEPGTVQVGTAPGTRKVGMSPAEEAAAKAIETEAVERAKLKVSQEPINAQRLTMGTGAIKKVDELLQHPGLSASTGLSSLNPLNRLPGSEAVNFKARLKELQGGVFLTAYNMLKGGGSITEVEGQKAEQAIARLEAAQSEPEFQRALIDYRDAVSDGMRKLGVQAPQDTPYVSTLRNKLGAAPMSPEAKKATQQPQGGGARSTTTAQPASWRAAGYSSADAAIRDGQNAVMRDPSSRGEVERRLNQIGLSLGSSGSNGSTRVATGRVQ